VLEEQMTLPVGAIVQDTYRGQYCVEKLLGKGGFGAVYLVSERRNKLKVFALKEVIDPSKQDRKRLLLERKVLKRLNHAALPRVYHVFEQERLKRVYLLMEYIEGQDLEVLRNEQPEKRFPVELVLTLLDPIVDAVIYLHQQEPPILHRDIKPANIIVPPDGSIATLVDFGTAKEYLPESTTSIFRYGTPGYAAIEQYSPESITDMRTDVYGLGATLYTLLTGVKPVDAVTRVTTEKGNEALQPANVLVPDIPQPVSQTIQRALSIHYEDRFATMGEFWRALHTDSGEQEGQVPALRPRDTSRPPLFDEDEESVDINPLAHSPGKLHDTLFRRRNWITVSSVALLVLIVVGLGLLFSHTHPATPTPFIQHASSRGSVLPSTSVATTPTTVTFPYPPIASSYAGTISDIAVAHKTTELYLMQVRQDQNSMSGNFQGLGLVGSFTGIVTHSGSVHFIVKFGTGSFIFDGEVKVGGDIEGNFYAVDQQGQNIGEYGLWYASATSA